MEENKQFNIEESIKNLFVYLKSTYQLQVLKFGKSVTKIITFLFIILFAIVFIPILLILLFITLGFGYHEWIGNIQLFPSFLLSAATVLLLCIILFLIGLLVLRKPKLKVYTTMLKHIGKIPEKKAEVKGTVIEENKNKEQML